MTLQAVDGVVTYAALSVFGIQAEGNPLIATWIGLTGAGPTLVGAKLLACGCGTILYVCGVHHILAGLSVFYLVGAVLPWLHTISTLSRI